MLLTNYSNNLLEAGADEAGRGCLAGPVTAAAIILPADFENLILNDSKQLSEKKRNYLQPIIKELATSFAIIHLHPREIEEINILNASMKAMQECLLLLKPSPEFVTVDGNRALNAKLGLSHKEGKLFTPKEIEFLKSLPNKSIVKGDSKYLSIAAASVLAKTSRDEYMDIIHEEFPMYNWKKNKGYPTKEHREAIRKFGTTPYHRMNFQLLPEQLKLEF